jgi:hypothetical protein
LETGQALQCPVHCPSIGFLEADQVLFASAFKQRVRRVPRYAVVRSSGKQQTERANDCIVCSTVLQCTPQWKVAEAKRVRLAAVTCQFCILAYKQASDERSLLVQASTSMQVPALQAIEISW